MTSEPDHPKLADELRALIEYLGSLWSILGSISVFFPLSNKLLRAVPLDSQVVSAVSPNLVTLIASVFTVFVVFDTFVERFRLIGTPIGTGNGPERFRRAAWAWLWSGALMLAAYLILYRHKDFLLWEYWQIGGGSLWNTVFDILLTTLYSGFFASITKAFMLLGMIEFYRSGARRI